MKFDSQTVQKIADLARVQLSNDEVTKFASQLEGVLEYINKLNELNTSGVEPLTHALDLDTPTRAADEVRASPGANQMLASAPEHLHDSFKVPQVLGGGN